MVHDAAPQIGNWYQHEDKGQKFEVVAIDEARSLVEVQYFGGNVDEFDLGDWYDLDIQPIETPQDWTGPVDDLGAEDADYAVSGYETQGWEEDLEDGRRSMTGRERELERPADAEPAAESPEEEEPREDL